VPAVVGVVLALFAPPPPLPLLEQAAANRVSATTKPESETRRRGRMVSDTVLPPGSQCIFWRQLTTLVQAAQRPHVAR
jgi:hypothetical protein